MFYIFMAMLLCFGILMMAKRKGKKKGGGGRCGWLELQMFADAGTNTNATGSYVNAYTGATTPFSGANDLSGEAKTYYDTEMLQNARPDLLFSQFAKKQGLPKNKGKTVEWRKWNTLADAGALQEGVIPTGQSFGVSTISQGIAQYGTYVAVTDELELHAIDNVILGATVELGASFGSTQDKLVRDVVAAGTNVLYCDKVSGSTKTAVTSRAGLDKTAVLTPDMVNQAATMLKKLHAPTIGGKYVAIIHPSVAYDIRSSSEWIEAHKYAAVTQIFTGEIGELHNVRFIESSNAKVWKGDGCPTGLAVYATIFLGLDAYGMIDPEGGNMHMIIKAKSEVGGPLEQFSTIGYKFDSATKILYQDRMLRVESCSKYSDVDAAN
jgi:N4-gp56 family major capsid protein